MREIAVAKTLDRDFMPGGFQEKLRGLFRFALSFWRRTKNQPVKFQFAIFLQQPQDGSAAPDFDVVAIRPEAKHLAQRLPVAAGNHPKHGGLSKAPAEPCAPKVQPPAPPRS